MKNKKYRSTISELLSALLFLAIGIILVAVLQRYYSASVLIIGVILVLIGVIKIVRFFTNHDKHASDVISFLIGILAILGAVAVFANIKPILDLGVVFLGAYILLSAVLRFSSVRKITKAGNQKMTLLTVLVVLEALCGIFSISAKVLLPEQMFQAAGGALIGFGLLEIVIILLTAKSRRIANKAR